MAIEFQNYRMSAASSAAAAQVFEGSWTTDFGEIGLADTGHAKLMNDARINWLIDRMGPVTDFNILELGSFEGAHSVTFARKGARSCIGIEANAQHFMRSLVVKNHLEANNLKFLLGDFNAYMQQSSLSFDLVSACGVLYHMTNPAELIALAAKRSRRLFLWTVLYDAELLVPGLESKIGPEEQLEYEGFSYVGRRHDYQMKLAHKLHEEGKFSGGSQEYSVWLEYDELARILEHYGYEIKSKSLNPEGSTQPSGHVTLYAEIPE